MSQHSYYGQNFEGVLITGISIFILLASIGAWTLMSSGLHDCKASDYTYCGESSEPQHGGATHE